MPFEAEEENEMSGTVIGRRIPFELVAAKEAFVRRLFLFGLRYLHAARASFRSPKSMLKAGETG